MMMGTTSEEGTLSFKGAVEQLIAAHVQETNDLRKVIAENEAKYVKKREKWQQDKTSLTTEIEKLRKNRQDQRSMLKKAQVLLDKYRSQLRNHINDGNEDATLEQVKDEVDNKVTPPKPKPNKTTSSPNDPKDPILPPPDCYIIISDSDFKKTPKNNQKTDPDKNKTKIEPDKTDSMDKSKHDETPTKGAKERRTSKKEVVDLSGDEAISDVNSTTNNTNNNSIRKNSIRKSNEYKANTNMNTTNTDANIDGDLLDDINATINSTNNNTSNTNNTTNNNSSTPKPTKTKYNKYNLTPKTKDTSSDSKTPKSARSTPTTKTTNKSNSANTSPDSDSDFYQKIYDKFSKSTSKRLADDLDFASSPPSSKPNASAMPPPPPPVASTKCSAVTYCRHRKFKYVEVVRNKEERAALPAHECDQCQKFYEALGDGYDRSKMVHNCSRHRARDAIPDTPPDYWQMSFPSSETQDI